MYLVTPWLETWTELQEYEYISNYRNNEDNSLL